MIEVCKDELIFWETVLIPLRPLTFWEEDVARALLIVISEVGVRHVDGFLTVDSVDPLGRRADFIGNDVIDVVSSHRATEAHVGHLDWSGSQHEEVCALTCCPAVEIKEDLDVLAMDELGKLNGVRSLRDLIELIATLLNLLTPFAAIIAPQTEANDLELRSVMQLKDRGE